MQPLVVLVLSNLAFLAGPLVLSFLGQNRRMGMFLDGLTYAAILTFCFFHVIPEVFESRAYYLFAIFLVGLFFPLCPQYFQKRFGIKNKKRISLGLWLSVVLGVAIHVFAEGAVLATQSTLSQLDFGISVIIHRFGIGLVVLNFFRSQKKSKVYAYSSLALLMIGTTCGFFFGNSFSSHSDSLGMLFIEVFIAGNLLHFINHTNVFSAEQKGHDGCGHDHGEHVHHHDHSCSHEDHHNTHEAIKRFVSQFTSGASFSSYGALTVMTLLLAEALAFGDSETRAQFLSLTKTFFHLFSESSFPLLFAFLFAGLFKALIRPVHLSWLEKGNPLTQTTKGVAFGLPLPICSCGVLPLYQSLVKKGVPVSAAVGFLIATPEIGFDAIFLSFALLGQNFTIIRLLCAFVLAVTVAVAFGYLYKSKQEKLTDEAAEQDTNFKERLREGLRYGFVDLVDHTIPWIVVGILMASFMEHFISYDVFADFSSIQQVLIMAAIGIPLYVCASGATPLAAILLHKGVSAGAVIAFLLAGPATNVSTFGILKKLHGKKFAILFGIGVISVAILVGLLVDLINLPFDKIAHSDVDKELSFFKWLGAALLAAIVITSFIRQGLRHFIEQLFSSSHSH